MARNSRSCALGHGAPSEVVNMDRMKMTLSIPSTSSRAVSVDTQSTPADRISAQSCDLSCGLTKQANRGPLPGAARCGRPRERQVRRTVLNRIRRVGIECEARRIEPVCRPFFHAAAAAGSRSAARACPKNRSISAFQKKIPTCRWPARQLRRRPLRPVAVHAPIAPCRPETLQRLDLTAFPARSPSSPPARERDGRGQRDTESSRIANSRTRKLCAKCSD